MGSKALGHLGGTPRRTAREGNLQKALCAAFPKHFEDLQQQMALADPDEAHGQARFR